MTSAQLQAEARARNGAAWDGAIERALRSERVDLALQPIVDLRHGVVAGYEALARFPGGPSASPLDWFAAAEARGLQVDLEVLVIRKAVALERPTNCFLSINVSPEALLAGAVGQVLRGARHPEAIVVELTEHTPMLSADLTRCLTAIREEGPLLAIDDTGSGYAGLQVLAALTPDIVKVDRALVADVDRNPVQAALVAMLGEVSGRMDAWLLAEGIETTEELETLVAMDVPLGQGYLLGRPAPTWSRPDPAVQAELGRLSKLQTSGEDLEPLMRSARWRPLAERAEAARELERRPDLDVIVLVDDRLRAVEVLRATTAGVTGNPPLLVKVTEPLAAVCRRCITRPLDQRWDPVIVTDALGRLRGLITVEAMVDQLAKQKEGTP